MRDPIAQLKHELLAAAERQLTPTPAVAAGARQFRVSLSRSRVLMTSATVAVAVAVAFLVTTPWKTAPSLGFLEEVQAALTPPAGAVLHWKVVQTENRPECKVVQPLIENWVDLKPPHNWRSIDVLQTDICSAGTPVEVGGVAGKRALVFRPPNTLETTGGWPGPLSADQLDPWGQFRQAIDNGTAHDEGRTLVDGRSLERIRFDCVDPTLDCGSMYVYVDPETFMPVRSMSGPGLQPGPGASCTAPCFVSDFLTYEYLPRTEDNLALTDIRAQHPDAAVVER